MLSASQTDGRQRQALHGVVAHPGHIVRAPLLQRRHQRLAGISRVEAHGGLPAQMQLRPLQHLQHELQPAVRRMHLPLAQPQVQDVARLPRRRHDRMIHAPVIVAVPRAARLFPVNLDRQAVDVDDQRLRTPPPAHRLQPPPRQPLQPLAQHLDALLLRPRRHPPRQRRLRGQAPGLAQRSRARPVAGTSRWRRCAPGGPAPPHRRQSGSRTHFEPRIQVEQGPLVLVDRSRHLASRPLVNKAG